MMRKLIAFGLLLAFAFSMAGYSKTKITFAIGNADKIELCSGTDGTIVETTDAEGIQYITNNINALAFNKSDSSKDHSGWSYSLKWYDAKTL